MAKAGKRVVRQHLKTLSVGECREQILELWERFPQVRDYFASRFDADAGSQVLRRAQTAIAREFSTSTLSPSARPSVARNIIREFKRTHGHREATIELMLFYVRAGTEYVAAFGDDRPIASIIAVFSEALNLAESEDLISKMKADIELTVDLGAKSSWGIDDALQDLWLQHEPWDEPGSGG